MLSASIGAPTLTVQVPHSVASERMPWRVGLDEAGYGPNLGPLVLSSSACHVPADAPECLWECLAAAVRKAEHPDDGRLVIDDSKKVNEGKAGLAKLEAGVLAAVGLHLSPPPPVSMSPPSPFRGGGWGGGRVGPPPFTTTSRPSPWASPSTTCAANRGSCPPTRS